MTEVRCPQCNSLIYEIDDDLNNVEPTTEKCPYCDYDPNPTDAEADQQQSEEGY